jgi:hypothetical protein
MNWPNCWYQAATLDTSSGDTILIPRASVLSSSAGELVQRLLKVYEEELVSKRSARASVSPELGERIVVLKKEGTAICDVGKHVRRRSQRVVLPLTNKPQPRVCSDAGL